MVVFPPWSLSEVFAPEGCRVQGLRKFRVVLMSSFDVESLSTVVGTLHLRTTDHVVSPLEIK